MKATELLRSIATEGGAIKTLRLNLKDFGLDEETRKVIDDLKKRRR